MITQTVWHVLAVIVAFLLGLVPNISLPSWWSTMTGYFATGIGNVTGLGNWLPIGAVGSAVVFILLAWGLAFAIRIARIGLSVFTGGGGGAA